MKGVILIELDDSEEVIKALLSNIQDQAEGIDDCSVRYEITYPPSPNDLLTYLQQPRANDEVAKYFKIELSEVGNLIGILLEEKMIMPSMRGGNDKKYEVTFKGLTAVMKSNPELMRSTMDRWEQDVPGTKERMGWEQ